MQYEKMSLNQNNTVWLLDIAGRNVSHLDFKFEMPDYIFALYILYLSGSMTIGIPGNFIVLAIYHKHKPSTNVDCYILSIAVLDVVCLAITVPMYIVMQTKIWDVIDVNTLCKALNFTGQIVTFAESFILCAMATERFIKVCRPKSSFYLDRRGKYIVLSIILSTIFISVPNVFFSWIDYHRSCVPITKPPWIASAFFLLTVSLFIAMFGIVTLSYTGVAYTLFQSAKKTAQNSIASRTIMGRNKIIPLPSQTDMMPTTSWTFERITNETSLSVQSNVTSIQIIASNPSSRQLVTGEAAWLGETQSHRDNTNIEIKRGNENDGNDLIIPGKTAVTTDRPSGICVQSLTRAEHIDTKVKQREKLVSESFEHMSSSQKRRLFKTTKVSFLITISFIISWLPVWIYTVMAVTKTYKDPYGGFFLKQSYLINAFMNPVLYLVCNGNFRKKAKGLFFKNQSTITS